MSLFEDLRQEAYGGHKRSYYEGVPVMTPTDKDAFDKDTDSDKLWKASKAFTDALFSPKRGK